MDTSESFLVQLSRLALAQRHDDVVALIRRASRRLSSSKPEVAKELQELLTEVPAISPVRGFGPTAPPLADPLPVDADSRLELIRREDPVNLEYEPIFSPELFGRLRVVLEERRNQSKLKGAGLSPTRSLLFTGPPGVGKTLAARWLAKESVLPLLTLDLSAVMSSFLGRTGSNLRAVLDYARVIPCVMLLDEFDACAKRRDDVTEIGELKRLVTVLLQAVDNWPSSGLLIAATNHPDLLDSAVWRRFDHVLAFPVPEMEELAKAIKLYLGQTTDLSPEWVRILTFAFSGCSFSDVERRLVSVRRRALLSGRASEEFLGEAVRDRLESLPRQARLEVAQLMEEAGISQRRISAITGVSRDTLRKHRDV